MILTQLILTQFYIKTPLQLILHAISPGAFDLQPVLSAIFLVNLAQSFQSRESSLRLRERLSSAGINPSDLMSYRACLPRSAIKPCPATNCRMLELVPLQVYCCNYELLRQHSRWHFLKGHFLWRHFTGHHDSVSRSRLICTFTISIPLDRIAGMV